MTLLATTFALVVALLATFCPACAAAAADAAAEHGLALQAFRAGALAMAQRPTGTVERRDGTHAAAAAAAGARWGLTAIAASGARAAGAAEHVASTWAERHPILPMAWIGRRGITAGICVRW